MKATIISVFKSRKYSISYCYWNSKKFNDDVESIEHYTQITPMMEMRLWKEHYNPIKESGLEPTTIITFATPEIIKAYTGFDLFEYQASYRFEGKVLDIEFEWEEKEYPYIRVYHHRDHIRTEILKLPKIFKIEEPKYDW